MVRIAIQSSAAEKLSSIRESCQLITHKRGQMSSTIDYHINKETKPKVTETLMCLFISKER